MSAHFTCAFIHIYAGIDLALQIKLGTEGKQRSCRASEEEIENGLKFRNIGSPCQKALNVCLPLFLVCMAINLWIPLWNQIKLAGFLISYLTLGSPFFLKSRSFMQVLYLELYLKIYCSGTQLYSFTISATLLRAMQPCPLPRQQPLYRNVNVYKFLMLSHVLLVSFL